MKDKPNEIKVSEQITPALPSLKKVYEYDIDAKPNKTYTAERKQ